MVATGNTFQKNRFRNVVAYTGTLDLVRTTMTGAQHGVLAVSLGEPRQAITRFNPANAAADANRVSGASQNGIWVRRVGGTPTQPFEPISMDDDPSAGAGSWNAFARG